MAVTVTLVRSPACHFCGDAQDALDELGQVYDITVELVEADTGQGQELIARHRPAMFPLILVDGSYFGAGRLSRGKLRALLSKRAQAGVRS